MSYNVLSIPPFDKQLKRLAKKYPSLKNEFAELLESLAQEPEQGTNLGNNCYKIRTAIASKGKGIPFHLKVQPERQVPFFALQFPAVGELRGRGAQALQTMSPRVKMTTGDQLPRGIVGVVALATRGGIVIKMRCLINFLPSL
jgi:hypothetical protein